MDKSSPLVAIWDKKEVTVAIVNRDTRNISRVARDNIFLVLHPMATKYLKDKRRTFGTLYLYCTWGKKWVWISIVIIYYFEEYLRLILSML